MKYADLTPKQRARYNANLARGLKLVAFAQGYDVVKGPDEMLRRRGTVEHFGEDKALPAWNRLKMINLARQGVRNGDSMRALMRQMEVNVVGTVGGRATFTFPDDRRLGDEIREAFAAWARECEFSDGLPLSKVLEIVVDTKFVGGDMVLAFDDGLVEDSGRLLAFEPDEIADVPKEWFFEKFPEDWTQRQGRIYNHNGRFMGVTVSHKYRGETMFPRDENGVFFLTKEAQPVQDWVMLREVWRFNQGRGVPSVAAPLDSLLDLESVTKYEVQAAMKNAQTLGQIVNTAPQADADEIPADLDPALLSAGEQAAADSGEADGVNPNDAPDGADEFELENIQGSGALFDLMPDNLKMELFDTKRPNPNVEGFVKWLCGRSGAAVGLSKFHATMEAINSYSGARAEIQASWRTFKMWQKNIERDVCDWVLRKWVGWATRKGLFDGTRLPNGWTHYVTWAWPDMLEIDSKAEAEANKIKLENGLITIEELRPGDPDGYVDTLKKDVERMHRAGLVHWMEKSVSGGTLTPGEVSKTDKNKGGDDAE